MNTLPATLNSLSTGADEAGIDRYFLDSLLREGNLLALAFQKVRGSMSSSATGSLKYVTCSGMTGAVEEAGAVFFMKLKSLLRFAGGGSVESVTGGVSARGSAPGSPAG